MSEPLMVGERAEKVGGSYQAKGTIVSAFRTTAGALRYVFEFDEPKGLLHIFGPEQLRRPEAVRALTDATEGPR